ncbi:hypothetical protein [Nocardioides jiangxiensis]|uniref:Uncharacterized protein n=1 Tax=Nocardioides jiangxiensis TaxID=3064524 RepID=A0ABT9B125_9ACTN|nr:hypothetical protein [Nocardioides sp. WY-20]MDO7868417.1 hypothetical protein [Nocardioides sp. WY-20]
MGQRGVGRGVGLAALAAGVLGTLVATTVAGAPPERSGEPGPSHVAPPETRSQAALFSCPEKHPVFTRHAPPVMHVQEERAKAERIASMAGGAWSVAFAEPTRLGVIAFVDGDLAAARPVLLAAGAGHVYRRDAGPELGDGKDHQALVESALGWALEKPMRDVRRRLRGLPHDGELAYWNEAGAVYVQWKPTQVAALAETYVDGALVVVGETPYSPREVTAAMNRIFAPRYERLTGARFTFGATCGDLSGVLLGVDPATLGDRGPRIQELLARAAGMPVHVVPAEPVKLQ